jgi:hypothetical protein
MADRWGAQFVVEGMASHGIRVEQSAKPKSDLYLDVLPLINSQLVVLLDLPKLARQLTGLERRASGHVDHKARSNDDVANAAVGSLMCGRTTFGRDLHLGVIGLCGHHEDRARARERQREEAELEQILPKAVRGDALTALGWLVMGEPAATVDEIAEVWRGFHAAGVLPPWTPELQQLAERMVTRAA